MEFKGWIVYIIYLVVHLLKTIFEGLRLRVKKDGTIEEVIYYRRYHRRQNVDSLRPKRNRHDIN